MKCIQDLRRVLLDQMKIGRLIRTLRLRHGYTQLQLASLIGVGDKAVSKWERGYGAPDISLLPVLSKVLGVDMEALLNGDLEEAMKCNDNIKKTRFYICHDCGNLVTSMDDAAIVCCGKRLSPLIPKKADDAHVLDIEKSDGGLFITTSHEMAKDHYISFVAFLTDDTMIVKKLYPEWNLQVRLPFFAHGLLVWYCSRDGLFLQRI